MLHILNANALHLPLADNTVQACITSPPYWGLRSYLPNAVQIKANLTDEEKKKLIEELERLGITPKVPR